MRFLAKEVGATPIEVSARTIPIGTHRTSMLPCEEGYIVLEWWQGRASVVLGICLHFNWPVTKIGNLCRHIFDPEKIEEHTIVPLGEQFHWQPGGSDEKDEDDF